MIQVKDRRIWVLVLLVVIAGWFMVTNLSTVDYNSITITITTEQGYVSTIRPNPSSLEDHVAWDDKNLVIEITLELLDQVQTIYTYTATLKEQGGYNFATETIYDRTIVTANSYTTSGEFLIIEMVINEDLINWQEVEYHPEYWLKVHVIGLDYRGEFDVTMDYYSFICLRPLDYLDYYGDITTTTTTTTTTTETPTTTNGETGITDQEAADPVSGFEIIVILAVVPVIIGRKWRKHND